MWDEGMANEAQALIDRLSGPGFSQKPTLTLENRNLIVRALRCLIETNAAHGQQATEEK